MSFRTSFRFGASYALLGVQLALVSCVAAKYLYERATCPRVWTRASVYDPALFLRGRYLGLQLTVDGCGSTLPSAGQAVFPRDINGAVTPGTYSIQQSQPVSFRARLKVENNKLAALQIPDEEQRAAGQLVFAPPGASCADLRLQQAVNFYVPEDAALPLPLHPGQELWVEVTVPVHGPPRPLQLALKQGGIWKPLLFQ